jgi:hypothetical protein
MTLDGLQRLQTLLVYRKTPLLVPEVGPFSNANIFVLDQFMTETKADFKI